MVTRLLSPGQVKSRPNGVSRSYSPISRTTGSTCWLELFGPSSSAVRSDSLPAVWAPMVTVLPSAPGPAGPKSERVSTSTTWSNAALVKASTRTSSPIRALLEGMVLLLGSGSPALTGIWRVSRIHCSDGSAAPPSPSVPRPRRTVDTFGDAGLPVVSSRAAACGPAAVGLNTTGKVALPPAGMVTGRAGPPERANEAACGPVRVAAVTVSGAPPVFLTTTSLAALAAPPLTSV